jgi:hypothetical protein
MPQVTQVSGQHNSAEGLGTGTVVTCSLANPIAAASLVVGMATCDDVATITRIRDDLAVDAVLQKALDWTAGTQRMEHRYYKNYGGGSRVFTLTTGSTDFRGIAIIELAGAHTTAPEGPTNSATGTSTTPSSGAVTPGADGAYLIGTAMSSSGLTPTTAAPFTSLERSTGLQADTNGLAQATNASQAAGWTLSGSVTWGALITSWLPGVSAPTVTPMQYKRRLAIQQRVA